MEDEEVQTGRMMTSTRLRRRKLERVDTDKNEDDNEYDHEDKSEDDEYDPEDRMMTNHQ